MQEDIIIQISSKLKEKRKEKGITLQQLADKAQVSKGLISQIENNRTIPSLLVLVNLIKALNIDFNDFFNDIQQDSDHPKAIVKKKEDYQTFEKEHAKGFSYKRILTKNINILPVDFVILELKKGASRSHLVKTDAFEYKYIIKGTVEYTIGDKKYILNEGDSLFFDASVGHKPTNIGDSEALILVIYFFNETHKN